MKFTCCGVSFGVVRDRTPLGGDLPVRRRSVGAQRPRRPVDLRRNGLAEKAAENRRLRDPRTRSGRASHARRHDGQLDARGAWLGGKRSRRRQPTLRHRRITGDVPGSIRHPCQGRGCWRERCARGGRVEGAEADFLPSTGLLGISLDTLLSIEDSGRARGGRGVDRRRPGVGVGTTPGLPA